MKSKVLIIGFTKIRYMPYLTFYLNAIDTEKNDVTLFYWNRDENPDIEPSKSITTKMFHFVMRDSEPKYRKIPAFLKFRKAVIKELCQTHYSFIIVLHTLPGVLINDVLLRNYKGRFILDYRDYTYEKIGIYKKIIENLARAARVTFVSSNAFRSYLPQLDNIYTSHNITLNTLENRPKNRSLQYKPIRIRYWGLIRYAKTNIRIIKQIKNDDRFEMHFHGRMQGEAEEIQRYCKDNCVNNVFFHGEYKPNERIDFARETDLIQNAQDYDEITKNAVSNKFYDGAIFYIPQLCTDISFMGQCLKKYGLGLPFDSGADNIADQIYYYISRLNYEQFKRSCDAYVEEVLREYQTGIKILKELLG